MLLIKNRIVKINLSLMIVNFDRKLNFLPKKSRTVSKKHLERALI
jgi:hypothetical protein